jgi:hypothetical protein
MLATSLAWTQAIGWMPLPWGWMRLALLVIVETLIFIAAPISRQLELSQASIATFFLVLLTLAYPLALHAVNMARLGQGIRSPLANLSMPRQSSGALQPFASSDTAQLWFEWKRNGSYAAAMIVGVVAILLLTTLLSLFSKTIDLNVRPRGQLSPAEYLTLVSSSPIGVLVLHIAVMVLVPMVMGSMLSHTLGQSEFFNTSRGMMLPFLAIRPISSTRIVAAKLKCATIVAACVWVSVLIAITCAICFTDARNLLSWPSPRGLCFGAIAAAGLYIAFWCRLTDAMILGLFGRRWLQVTLGCLTLLLWVALTQLGRYLYYHPADLARLRRAFPLIAGAMIILKLVAAIWVARASVRKRLVAPGTLACGYLIWFLTVIVGVLTIRHYIPHNLLSLTTMILLVMLALPLVHIAASPLALNASRHR